MFNPLPNISGNEIFWQRLLMIFLFLYIEVSWRYPEYTVTTSLPISLLPLSKIITPVSLRVHTELLSWASVM
jgi:hypothetical protein